MISCPNCGGNVKFDIPSQKLACDYCHELFDPYAFESKTSDAEEEKSYESDYEVTIFTCPQCGGEILSTENAAAGFCSFCGASTILYSRISHERRPNFIIPFQKTKDECKQAYADLMKHAIFAPKELKDPKYIDGFRGIYMPYWAYYITQKGDLHLQGEKSHRSGDYIYTDHYNLSGYINSYYKGLSYDASSSFADNISENLAPYDLKGMKAFTPGYLSGFYADTADVDPSVYQSDAEETAFKESFESLKKVPQYASLTIKTPAGKASQPQFLNTRTEGVDSTMFPVWFMSYRQKDRVAYVTINGQTGKVVADVPADPKKYLIGSLILAIPIFILLALFVTLLPSRLLALSAILAIVASVICTVELSSIAKKDSHLDDRGILYKENPEKLAEVSAKKAKKRKKNKTISITIWLMLIFMFGTQILAIIGTGIFSSPSLLWGLIVIALAITVGIGSSKMSSLPTKQSVVGFISAAAAVIIGAVIALINPVSDLYYYGGTILSMIAVILCFTDIIRYYNVLSTRRLPQFDKQGGDNRA